MNAGPARAEERQFEGTFFRGEGDVEYLQLLDISRRMFAADPEFQNLGMLYTPRWNGFVEGPTWGAWWIQNSYGPTYCALPFLTEPYVTFLQNAQDLWFDQMGDGTRTYTWRDHEWVVPDGQLCDAASPNWVVPKQGDGRVDIHDWGVEFTAAGVLMQAELLLISRDADAVKRYLPKLERCANFLETRRDPENNLFLAGAAGNLLAPSYAGWRKPDGSFAKAYLAGLSITYIAALDRLIELEKLLGNAGKVDLYTERRDLAYGGLPLLTTEEGYFVKSLDPDGTKHGVYGAEKHGYFEAVCNHDAICFRVADDAQAERIYAKIQAIPGLRRHDLIITNEPGLDDMYRPPTSWLWQHGTWVNGGHWSTCEARMIMGYYRLGKHEDARRAMQKMLEFARIFRLGNPLVDFGNAVYQPKQAINLCYDSFGPPAAMVRGLFEYLYRAEGLTVLPHIPAGITRLEQHFPIRFGTKRLYFATTGTGPVTGVLVNGEPWRHFAATSVVFRYEDTPDEAIVKIALGGAEHLPFEPKRPVQQLPPVRPPDEAHLDPERFPPITPNDLPLRIGADSSGGSRFVGDIAQPRIFARALSPDEIERLAAERTRTQEADLSLLGDWDFSDLREGAFANPASEDLPARTVAQIEVVDSPHGKAIRLAGHGYVEIADHPALDLTKACTMAAWVCPGTLPKTGARILDKTTVGAADGYLLDTFPGNSLRLICERGSVGHAAKLAPGRWAHVAATIAADGSLALYLNGECVASGKPSAPSDLTRLHKRVGRMRQFYDRLPAAGLGNTYEAAHARLCAEHFGSLCRRLELLSEGKLDLLPGPSQRAADRSYVATVSALCDGLERTLAAYAESGDGQRQRVLEAWRQQ